LSSPASAARNNFRAQRSENDHFPVNAENFSNRLMAGGGEIAFLYVEREISRRWSLQVMNAIQERLLRWGNREK
jgi:hypothetical protein